MLAGVTLVTGSDAVRISSPVHGLALCSMKLNYGRLPESQSTLL